jgi:hypothetical protein
MVTGIMSTVMSTPLAEIQMEYMVVGMEFKVIKIECLVVPMAFAEMQMQLSVIKIMFMAMQMQSLDAKTKSKEPVTKFGEDILDPIVFIFKISKQTYLIFLLEIKRKSYIF